MTTPCMHQEGTVLHHHASHHPLVPLNENGPLCGARTHEETSCKLTHSHQDPYKKLVHEHVQHDLNKWAPVCSVHFRLDQDIPM